MEPINGCLLTSQGRTIHPRRDGTSGSHFFGLRGAELSIPVGMELRGGHSRKGGMGTIHPRRDGTWLTNGLVKVLLELSIPVGMELDKREKNNDGRENYPSP